MLPRGRLGLLNVGRIALERSFVSFDCCKVNTIALSVSVVFQWWLSPHLSYLQRATPPSSWPSATSTFNRAVLVSTAHRLNNTSGRTVVASSPSTLDKYTPVSTLNSITDLIGLLLKFD